MIYIITQEDTAAMRTTAARAPSPTRRGSAPSIEVLQICRSLNTLSGPVPNKVASDITSNLEVIKVSKTRISEERDISHPITLAQRIRRAWVTRC